ncbi:MAG: hypothetical protein WKF97_04675 [Chitinophagaceae bacterium]
MSKVLAIKLTVCFLLFFTNIFSQQKDTTQPQPARKRFFHNIFQQVIDAVTVSRKDSVGKPALLNTKSESPYRSYEGKIIRRIITSELGFEKTFTDTTRKINYYGTRILNALHVDTREWVIRDNLFIRENSALNGYMLADNERYLRSLEFIQDARILVMPINGNQDSVDVMVITKDLFSITGGIDVYGIDRVRARAAETNLMGMGQKVQFTTLYDKNRQPAFGYEFLYSKNSIKNTFVNATIGYTLINTGRSDGTEDEEAIYLKVDRPLVSPYSHLAGGFELSYNHSENFYRKPDSLFYKYRYNVVDLWGGYNLGVTKLLLSDNRIRDRSFIALRYLRNHFAEAPFQLKDDYDPLYNSRQALLAEFTLFRQNFYKTNYIYGFGTTEDLPYGFNLALTGGWYKQLNLNRPYAGVNFSHYIATPKGEFTQYFFRAGGFWNRGKLQDARLLFGGTFFSKLYVYKQVKIREYIKLSYTGLFNRITSEPLRIDNAFGLRAFRSDSVFGDQRISMYSETLMYAKYKVLGFQLAPFVFADLSLLSPEKSTKFRSGLYTGFGGGIRTRNENLVFGTMELRFIYFPRITEKLNSFKISFKSNLRFRYNSRYVKAPEIIPLNSDDTNILY